MSACGPTPPWMAFAFDAPNTKAVAQVTIRVSTTLIVFMKLQNADVRLHTVFC